jgi:hypothetical protein
MNDFDALINQLMDDVDDEPNIYGLRIMYYHPTDPDQRITALVPWLSYDLPTAERMRHIVATTGVLQEAALRRTEHTDIPWVPMGVKVVTLAEIPF